MHLVGLQIGNAYSLHAAFVNEKLTYVSLELASFILRYLLTFFVKKFNKRIFTPVAFTILVYQGATGLFNEGPIPAALGIIRYFKENFARAKFGLSQWTLPKNIQLMPRLH